jgi:hypothetical protein
MLVKVLLNLGPENTYEKMLAAEEEMRLKVAAHKRTVRRAADSLMAETVLDETRNRLAGWTADIPEIAQDIVDSRRRVEKKRISTWADDQIRRIDNREDAASDGPEAGLQPPLVYFPSWPWAGEPAPRRRPFGFRPGRRAAQDGPADQPVPEGAPPRPGEPGPQGGDRPSLWESVTRRLGWGRRAKPRSPSRREQAFPRDPYRTVPVNHGQDARLSGQEPTQPAGPAAPNGHREGPTGPDTAPPF